MHKGKILLNFYTEPYENYLPKQAEFMDKLTDIMKNINPSHLWESPDYPHRWIEKEMSDDIRKPRNPLDLKFYKDSGYEITTLFSGPFIPEQIDVYEYGKDELRFSIITNKRKINYKVLKACNEDFYRDWERNGICVQAKEPSWRDFIP
jgi:hypothetical protein